MAGQVGVFHCLKCGADFTVSETILSKYPGWQPKICRSCKDQTARGPRPKSAHASAKRGKTSGSREQDLTLDEVLSRYTEGPKDGVFTDGAAEPNPGPGGWGAVYVRDDEVKARDHGSSPHTTNNRMELTALISGCALVAPGETTVLYTDSNLCVQTINEWAAGWEQRGWKRKGGPIKNLELVQELYRIFQSRPELSLRWIAAHSGNRWNEYADSLATAYRRESL